MLEEDIDPDPDPFPPPALCRFCALSNTAEGSFALENEKRTEGLLLPAFLFVRSSFVCERAKVGWLSIVVA